MARKKTTTNMSISHINSNSAVLLHSAVSGDHNNHKVPGQTLNHNFIFNQIKLITSALIDSGLNCCLAFAISLTHTGRERLCVCVCVCERAKHWSGVCRAKWLRRAVGEKHEGGEWLVCFTGPERVVIQRDMWGDGRRNIGSWWRKGKRLFPTAIHVCIHNFMAKH